MLRVAAAIAVAACALGGNAAARDLQDVLNAGTLRVGVTLFAPWAARATDGELIGFEVDVARQLAVDMDVKAQFLTYDVDRLIPALESGEIDIIAAGMTITPERALHVNFSEPYAESGIGLATHVERTASVTDAAALDSENYTIAAVEGSVGAELARRLWPRARVEVFTSVEAASEALLARQSARLCRGRARADLLGAREPRRHRRPDGAAAAREPGGFRGRQRRRRLPCFPERVDHCARGGHLAADDGRLIGSNRCGGGSGSAMRVLERRFAAVLAALGTIVASPLAAQDPNAPRAPRILNTPPASAPVPAPAAIEPEQLRVSLPSLGGAGRPPNAARLAPLPGERDNEPEEIIVIGQGWRLPDLGSEWRARQKEAERSRRFSATALPLYDPARPPPHTDAFTSPEQRRHGYIDLFRLRFGRRSSD